MKTGKNRSNYAKTGRFLRIYFSSATEFLPCFLARWFLSTPRGVTFGQNIYPWLGGWVLIQCLPYVSVFGWVSVCVCVCVCVCVSGFLFIRISFRERKKIHGNMGRVAGEGEWLFWTRLWGRERSPMKFHAVFITNISDLERAERALCFLRFWWLGGCILTMILYYSFWKSEECLHVNVLPQYRPPPPFFVRIHWIFGSDPNGSLGSGSSASGFRMDFSVWLT